MPSVQSDPHIRSCLVLFVSSVITVFMFPFNSQQIPIQLLQLLYTEERVELMEVYGKLVGKVNWFTRDGVHLSLTCLQMNW